MSALETFNWFVETQLQAKPPAVEAFIREQRQYFFTLRSEDERQRFVEWVLEEVSRKVLAEGPRNSAG